MDTLGLERTGSLVTAAAAAAAAANVEGVADRIAILVEPSVEEGQTPDAVGISRSVQHGSHAGSAAGGTLSMLRMKSFLARGSSFGNLGDAAQRAGAKSRSGPSNSGAAAGAAAQAQSLLGGSSSAVRGQLSVRVWLLVVYVALLHLGLMMSFTSPGPTSRLAFSPVELTKLCSGQVGLPGAAAAAFDPRMHALP